MDQVGWQNGMHRHFDLDKVVKVIRLALATPVAAATPTDQFGRTADTVRFQNMMDAGDEE